jgi:hypothetical protein
MNWKAGGGTAVGCWDGGATVSVGCAKGGSVGGGGGSVAETAGGSAGSVGWLPEMGAMAVKVAVIPGTGVGMKMAVAVMVGRTRVGARVACATLVEEDDADWARSASRLDIKLVRATYSPSITTSKTIKKPKTYPLFIGPMVSSIVSNAPDEQPMARTVRVPRCFASAKREPIILEKRAYGKQLSKRGARADVRQSRR